MYFSVAIHIKRKGVTKILVADMSVYVFFLLKKIKRCRMFSNGKICIVREGRGAQNVTDMSATYSFFYAFPKALNRSKRLRLRFKKVLNVFQGITASGLLVQRRKLRRENTRIQKFKNPKDVK